MVEKSILCINIVILTILIYNMIYPYMSILFSKRKALAPSVLSVLIMSDSWSCVSNKAQHTVYFLNLTSF